MVGAKWGPSCITEMSRINRSGQGALARIRLRTTTNFISIYGVYWPCVPQLGGSNDSTRKLWSRIHAFCTLNVMHNPDPIEYIQSLIEQWMSHDWEDKGDGVIIGGDFNSVWSSGESGGQRILSTWAEPRFLINGPRQITDRGGYHFHTFAKNAWASGSWIDHILHAGPPELIDIVGAFNDQGPFTEQLTDHHRPLIAVYRTSPPASNKVVEMPKIPPRPEIPRGDIHQINHFKMALRDALGRITVTPTSPIEIEMALEDATAYTVQLVREINKAHGSRKGRRHKDGYSPEYVLRKLHLCGIIAIRRHLTGQHGKTRWSDFTTVRAGIEYVFRILNSRGESMGIPQISIKRILDVDRASLEYFRSLPSAPSPQACDEAIHLLRKKLQGRARTEMRLAHKGYMSFIESNREKGRLKQVIKAILGSHAGRRHQDGLCMDSVRRNNGEVIGDPAQVHALWTDHFTDFYRTPPEFDNDLHRVEDWEPIINSRERFFAIFQLSNIPTWCLEIVFTSLQKKPQASNVLEDLTLALAEPPTLEDLYKSIRCAKTNSAPGPSGLSYNMLKSMPRAMVEYIHFLLVQLWHSRTKPESWGWRWLHLISKTLQENVGLKDCRPIMLCEALRKLWTTIILSKITSAFTKHHVLEEIQHGFVSAKGTDTASILHLNHMEEVEERTGISHQSSFDFERAFDSTSIPSINWGLRRVGVPDCIARDMATSDVRGTTVVRSPFAQFLWSQLPYRCVRTSGAYPPGGTPATHDSALVASFCPERGTGQGLTDSPTKWNLIFDIIATGLRLLNSQENDPTYVGAEDNDMYEHQDILYADDHKAASASADLLQKKAELVSAFCIVLGLRLSQKKSDE